MMIIIMTTVESKIDKSRKDPGYFFGCSDCLLATDGVALLQARDRVALLNMG
jgi:hypothetical protein